MLKRHEGKSLKRYRCPAGHWTIGWGWNIDSHPLPPDIASCLNVTGAITEDMAEQLLTISIASATADCRAVYPKFDDFAEARQAALIDFMFNVGSTTALKFKKMRAAIEAGNWGLAADEMAFSAWFSQVGFRGPEIVGMVRKG